MKQLSNNEKWSLLQHHAERLGRNRASVFLGKPNRKELLETASRITEIIKSMPKTEFEQEQ